MTAMVKESERGELRRIVLETRTERRAGGVPMETRARAVSVMHAGLAAGTLSVRDLARELGVHEMTLYRWARDVDGATTKAPKRRKKPRAGFQQVHVVASPSTSPIRAAHPSSGLVIDAPDVRTLAALIRELGT